MRRAVVAMAAVAAVACSWGEFDDLRDGAPVEVLDRPGLITSGFGTTIAAAGPTSGLLLLGGFPGQAGVVVLDLNQRTRPERNLCEDPTRCRLVGSPVAVPDRQDGQGCFLFGVGAGVDGLGPDVGLLGGCASGTSFKLPLPGALATLLQQALFANSGPRVFMNVLSMASSGASFAIGSPDLQRATLVVGTQAGVEVAPPADEPGFAASLALADDGKGQRVLAVGSPGLGQVRFFDGDTKGVTPRACVRRGGSYGVTMRGLVDGPRRLVVVSDAAGLVEVIDPGKLPVSPSCMEPPAEAVVDTFHCIDGDVVKGCDAAAFGYALDAVDIDRDGHPEVIVGAPGLNVRDRVNAGAMMVFPIDAASDEGRPLYLPSADDNDRLGSALAVVAIEGKLAVATSALDHEKLVLFTCVKPGGEGCP